ncbi:thioredoxin family protein [Rhodovibrionaceae bacterium A322]
MKRRLFLAAITALLMFAAAAPGHALETYTPGLVKKALADGKTVFVDYKAAWCSTCAAQERVIQALRAENPAYDQSMVFVAVDWDDYRGHDITKAHNIPRRSTLILLKGDQELGRIVAGTSKGQIKELMDKGL